MKVLTQMDQFALACKAAKKFGLYISFEAQPGMNEKKLAELYKAAPYLKELGKEDPGHLITILFDGHATFLCDTQQEVVKLFNSTVGDDGPTKANPYRGSCKVFALTCDNKGKLMSENT